MSKSALKSINHSIYQLMKQQKGTLSFEKRYGTTSRLTTIAKELHALGYVLRNIKGLKQKHVQELVSHWQSKSLSVGTIKNRLSDLRFACRTFGRSNVIKNNSDYNIGSRSHVATVNKAIFTPDFSKIKDEHLKHSLEIQRVFGLRREECLKIIPSLADKGNHLWLKGSWTKGKVQRTIPIRTQEQRDALENAKNFVGKNRSLIPQSKSYIQQRYTYDRETRDAGFKNMHGLRHAYAQKRYKEITGVPSPINGGKEQKKLSSSERQLDRTARHIISNELGHSRISITKTYLG